MRYIVRGVSRVTGAHLWAAKIGSNDYTFRPLRQQAEDLELKDAISAWCDADALCDAPRIYQVAEDGAETPLPTYAESLQSNAAAHDALDSIVARQDAISDPPLPLHVRAATAARIVHETLAGRDEAVELLGVHHARRANAKEAIARLREALESGEYTFNSKVESALLDVEEAIK